MKLPIKSEVYLYKGDNTLWQVWEGEDFSTDSVLMYEKESGEDGVFDLGDFWKYFREVSIKDL